MSDYKVFLEANNAKDLADYFDDDRPYRHTNYFHYTTLKNIVKILSSQEILISSVKGFNDKKDSEQLAADDLAFALCFSTGVSESLPLWYLYAGIEGNGGRIGFKKNTIESLIKSLKLKLKLYDKNEYMKGNKDGALIKELNKTDYKIRFHDAIYYCYENKKGTAIKYNNMAIYNIPRDELDKYLATINGFKKGLIWFYEKETRLLIELTKTDDFLQKYNNDELVIGLDLSDVIKDITITTAPNIESLKDVVEFESKLKFKSTVLNDAVYINTNIKLSEYKGQIKMNLLEQNADQFIDYIQNSNEKSELVCEKLSEKGFCKNKEETK